MPDMQTSVQDLDPGLKGGYENHGEPKVSQGQGGPKDLDTAHIYKIGTQDYQGANGVMHRRVHPNSARTGHKVDKYPKPEMGAPADEKIRGYGGGFQQWGAYAEGGMVQAQGGGRQQQGPILPQGPQMVAPQQPMQAPQMSAPQQPVQAPPMAVSQPPMQAPRMSAPQQPMQRYSAAPRHARAFMPAYGAHFGQQGMHLPQRFAEGGDVQPQRAQGALPRRQARDTIPAYLAEGEYVIPADVVQSLGIQHFDKLVKKYHRPGA